MNYYTGLILLQYFILATTLGYSQANKFPETKFLNPEVIPVVYHGQTVALRNYVEDPNAPNNITKTVKHGYHPKSGWASNEWDLSNAMPQGEDPALQKNYPASSVDNRTLSLAWDGIPAETSPADPCADVGPNHVVQMINGGSGSKFIVWDKNGNLLKQSTTFDNFLATSNENGLSGWDGAGDPIVMYDERADRWILTEFEAPGKSNRLYIAVSSSSDPLGKYYTYSVKAPSFPDYPKYSIWDDAIVITTNESGGGSGVYVMNRTDILAGKSTNSQRFSMAKFSSIAFQASTPVSLAGTATSNSKPMVMRMRDDGWSGVNDDALEIWEIDINWTNSSSSSLKMKKVIQVDAFDTHLCGYTGMKCFPQPSSSTTLDPLRELLMNRVFYRKFDGHESIVCCHVVDVNGSDHGGVRWYELRKSGGADWSVYQQGTYSPDSDHRFMCTIGISASGNIGLAYNVTGSYTYPSARYTGRKHCDPLNQMTFPETEIAKGTKACISNRYGDYCSLGIDPSDGETFWFTGMYNKTNIGNTRIGAFKIPPCGAFVSFEKPEKSVEEQNSTEKEGCRNYQVIDIPISIGASPSADANVTVKVNGGTATQNLDYELINSTCTLNGSSLTSNIQIKVFNDDYVEGNETIILGYTLNANGGDAQSGTNGQTITITINDDDQDINSMVVSNILLSENFENGLGSFIANNPSGDDAFQIGDGTTPNSQYFKPGDGNNSKYVYVNDDDCNCNQNNVVLTFPAVDLSNYSGGELKFKSYFYEGSYEQNTESAVIKVSVNGGAQQTLGSLTKLNYVAGSNSFPSNWANENYDLAAYAGKSNVVFSIHYSDNGGWLYGCGIDNIEILGNSPVQVQTAVNVGNSQESYLGPQETVHFYDPSSGRLIMTIENESNHDFGCVTPEIDRAGNSSGPAAIAFADDNNNLLHSKTFKLKCDNNNNGAKCKIKLYYDNKEVSDWEAQSGGNRNNSTLVYVQGNAQIADVTSANLSSFNVITSAATASQISAGMSFVSTVSGLEGGLGTGNYGFTSSDGPESVENTIVLYPNPSSGESNIIGLEFGSIFKVYDANGKEVLSQIASSTKESVNLKDIANGKYFLHGIGKGKKQVIEFIISN